MRLFEMIDLADMPGGMRELEPDALAVPAGRKAPALDHRHPVRHVRMRGIVSDRVNAGLRYNAMLSSKANLSTIWGTAYNATVFPGRLSQRVRVSQKIGIQSDLPGG
jgi:hypothetical protein